MRCSIDRDDKKENVAPNVLKSSEQLSPLSQNEKKRHRDNLCTELFSEGKKTKKQRIEHLIQRISQVELPSSPYVEPVYDDCEVTRDKIRNFIAENGISQTRFSKAIDVGPGVLKNFMKLDGWGPRAGGSSSAYGNAYRFFEQKRIIDGESKSKIRKENEIKWGSSGIPTNVDMRKAKYSSGVVPKNPLMLRAPPSESKKEKQERIQKLVEDISKVELPSAPYVEPVYDDCDVVRGKIKRFITQTGMSQAGFAKAIYVGPGVLKNFLKLEHLGKRAGGSSSAYSMAYRFFEQKRILDGELKSVLREKNEEKWGKSGIPTNVDIRKYRP